jgi:hypothetical protein
MMNVPTEMEDPHARSDEFLIWLYQKTLDDPDFSFYGYDEAWEESFGKDAKKCFYSLKERQYLLYKKNDSNSYSFGSSSLPTAVGLNKKAIRYARKLATPPPKVQPVVKKPEPVESEPEVTRELEEEVAWFIYHTTGNMRTALNYLEDAKIYLQKEPLANKKAAEKEILAMEELALQIVAKEELEG